MGAAVDASPAAALLAGEAELAPAAFSAADVLVLSDIESSEVR